MRSEPELGFVTACGPICARTGVKTTPPASQRISPVRPGMKLHPEGPSGYPTLRTGHSLGKDCETRARTAVRRSHMFAYFTQVNSRG